MVLLVGLGILVGVLICSRPKTKAISVRYLGITNNYYAAFQVMNSTRKTVVYADGLTEVRTEAGWQKAPGRFRHIPAQLISSAGTGAVLVAIPKSANPWRARLRFESFERTPRGTVINFFRCNLRLPIETYSVFSQEIRE
jgi:hypothetical protein